MAVPDFYGAVCACGGDPLAIVVGAERQGVDLSTVFAPESPKFIACLHVPDDDRVLLAPRRQPPAVRAEGDVHPRSGDPRPDGGNTRLRLSVQILLVQPLRVPDFHGPVAARRSQQVAVATENQAAD